MERVTQNEVTQTEVVPLRRFLKRYFFTKKLFSNSFEFRELGTTPSSDAELGGGGGGGGGWGGGRWYINTTSNFLIQ